MDAVLPTNFLSYVSAIMSAGANELLVAQKDETIRIQDAIIAQKDETIRVQAAALAREAAALAREAASKEEMVRVLVAAKEEADRFNRDIIAQKNAKLMDLQGRLALRFAVDEFEKKVTWAEVDHMTLLLKLRRGGGEAPSTREATWEVILRSEMNLIAKHLIGEYRALTDEEVKRWVIAVQDLYRVASKYMDNYSPDKVSINTVGLSEDAITLAVGICETLPVTYTLIEREESANPAGYDA